MNTLSNRRHHAFLSYSHKDKEIALELYRWLTQKAGFDIWFDENHLEAGSPVAKSLSENMSDCRTWIVLASKNSVASSWVAAERDEALHCATENRDFSLVILHIDDCNLAQMWPSLKRFTWLEMPGGILTPAIAREIINRLDGRAWSGRYIGLRDVYVSRGWRPTDLPFADAVCKAFCEHRHMLRLIGDMPDQKSFSKERIHEILSSCCGHLVILPRRSPTEEAYKYIIQELTISAALEIPTLLIAEADTPLPESLAKSVNRLAHNEDYTIIWSIEPPEWMELFKEDLKEPLSSNHLFLAAEFKENMQWVTQFREFIESVTGLPCYIGRDFEGQGLRDKIVSSIASATVVIANLANFEETAPNKNSVNLNTCVEAGIALGASNTRIINGLKSLPVFLISQSSPEARGRTAQLPFMFRDSQITWYSTHVELLGQCRRLLQPYRRRIINYEFAKSEF